MSDFGPGKRGFAPRRAELVAVVLSWALLAGCATANQTEQTSADQSTVDKEGAERIPPGSQAWDELAEMLPADSPVVLTVRADRLFANADALREWLFAEPAMFGEDGPALIRGWKRRWQALVARTGGNPLEPDMLESLAVDTTRPMRAGLYPVSGGGEQDEYISSVERVIREKFGLSDQRAMLGRLEQAQLDGKEFPSGLYDSAESAVSQLRPNLGGRVVIPTTDAQRFIDHARGMAEVAGYATFDDIGVAGTRQSSANGDTDGRGASVLGLYKTGSRWPGMVIRARGDAAVIDVLYRPFEVPSSSDVGAPTDIKESLEAAVDTYEAGRPSAPAPRGIPIATISADQKGTASFIRLLGYLQAVGAVGTTAAKRRDKLFTGGVMSTLMTDNKWRVASERLTGLTYSLTGTLGSADRMFGVHMTMFGAPPSRELMLSPTRVSLGVKDRSMAASFDLKPLFDGAWQNWLSVEHPADLVEMSDATRTRPFFSALAMPRNAALAFVNADRIPREELPQMFRQLHDHRKLLGRFEIATSGVDVGQLRSKPKIATLLTLDDSAASEDRHQVLQALTPVLNDFLKTASAGGHTSERADDPDTTSESVTASLGEITENALTALPSADDRPSVRYFASAKEESPFFLMTYGLSNKQASGEVTRARDGETPEAASTLAYVRLEPAALFALVSAVDDRPTEPFDTGIVAQRLGPLTLTAESHRHESFQTLEYSFTLHTPPEL